jgi:tetratricopeptide (TPR) repeat protein
LTSAKIFPSWTPADESTAAGTNLEQTPRFWQGLVAQMRETGEIQVTLCWEQGLDYNEARLFSFLLDFWQEGVKDFYTTTGTKRHINDELDTLHNAAQSAAQASNEKPVGFVPCTLAEGRRLLNEALEVNRWRHTDPHKDFRKYLTSIQQLILHAKEAGADSGQTFIVSGLEPDIAAVNFSAAWSLGDYGLCYDLLTSTSALREGLDRATWVESRRKWHDEAHPARFEMQFLQEVEQPQSSLWLPSSARSPRTPSDRRIELGWSLELTDTPLSGTLPEMPLATAKYRETGRGWFWSIFTLAQEHDEWRLASIKDEGAAVQGLSQAEIEQQRHEHSDRITQILQEHNPQDPDAEQFFDEVIWRTWKIMTYEDALLVKNPQDKDLHEDAYSRAVSIRALERAAVYALALVEKFPDDLLAQQRYSAALVALTERSAAQGLADRSATLAQLAEDTMRSALSPDEPMGYLLLGEFLTSEGKFDEAEQAFSEARTHAKDLDLQTQALFDLANLAQQQKHWPEAQKYLENLAELNPKYPELWFNLGYVQRNLENHAEAEVYYKRAIEENSQEIRAYADLAAIYLNRREFAPTRDLLSQGIRNIPQSAHLRALMAAAYLTHNDKVRAREYLQEAERINPDLDLVLALREQLNAQ